MNRPFAPQWLRSLTKLPGMLRTPSRSPARTISRVSRTSFRHRLSLGLESLEDRATPAAGNLDPTFSGDGLMQFGFTFGAGNNTDEVRDAVLQPNGKIVLVGSVEAANGKKDFAVYRLNADGSTDTSFSGDGLQTIPFDTWLGGTGPTDDQANAVTLLADGRLVVVGQTHHVALGVSLAVSIVRPNGDIDTSFGFSGLVQLDFSPSGLESAYNIATDVVVQADGKVVVVGNFTNDNNEIDITTVRLNPNGSRFDAVDQTYGTVGHTEIGFDFGDTKTEFVTAAAIQPDGKIVLVGSIDSVDTGDFDVAVMRLNTNGTLDSTFDGNGLRRVRLNYGGGNNEAAARVVLQPDGKIVVSAVANAPAPNDYALAVIRLNSNGAMDSSFGTGGIRRIDLALEDDPIEDGFVPLALQPDGKIILAATTPTSGSNNDFYVTRLNSNGTTDIQFGTAGNRRVNFPQSNDDDGAVTAILVQPDGKIVLAGYVDTTSASTQFAVARLEGVTPAPGRTLTVAGPVDGSAIQYVPNAAGQYIANVSLKPFGTVSANVRTAVADVNGDSIPDTILVTGPGTPIRVAVVSGANNSTVLVQPFDPFGGDFTGGGFIAAADINGDGRAEFTVTPDQGGGPRVCIFSLLANGTRQLRANFFGIDDPNFRGGARPALGDVNRDGTPDLAVSAGFLGGPRTARSMAERYSPRLLGSSATSSHSPVRMQPHSGTASLSQWGT